MGFNHFAHVLRFTILFFALGWTATAYAVPMYNFKPIDLDGAKWALPTDINDTGQIVGSIYTNGPMGLTTIRFHYDGETTHTIPVYAAKPNYKTFINNSGDIKGDLQWKGTGLFSYVSGEVHKEASFPYEGKNREGRPVNLNEDGSTTLALHGYGGDVLAVNYDGTSTTLLATFDPYTYLRDANENGWMIGEDHTGEFVYNGERSYLEDFTGSLYDINNNNVAVGLTGDSQAAIYDQDGLRTLGISDTLAWYSRARAINDNDQIVGHSTLSDYHTHGTLWENEKLYDLNDLIAEKGVIIADAFAINNRGQIAVTYAHDYNYVETQFLPNMAILTPILSTPEPSTFILLGIGLIGLIGFGRKRFKA